MTPNPTFRLSTVVALAAVVASLSTAAAEKLPSFMAEPVAIEYSPKGDLDRFYRRLASMRADEAQKPINIVHFGDSHTAADFFTGTVRVGLQERFGKAGAGFIQPGDVFRGYRHTEARITSTSGWDRERVPLYLPRDLPEDTYYGLGGYSAESGNPNDTITVTLDEGNEADIVRVFVLRQPGGGDLACYAEGLEQPAVLSTDARYTHADYEVFAIRKETGALLPFREFTVKPVGNGPVRVLGFSVEQKSGGIIYHSMGINGAQVSNLLAREPEMMREYLNELSPDLIVLWFGGNDLAGLTPRGSTSEARRQDFLKKLTRYEGNFNRLMQNLNQWVPQTDILVVGITDRVNKKDRRGNYRAPYGLQELIQAQRRVAFANGAGFWNTQKAMGGEGVMREYVSHSPRLASRDRVHLTSTGYKYLGVKFYESLVSGYTRFVTEGSLAQARVGMDSGKIVISNENDRGQVASN